MPICQVTKLLGFQVAKMPSCQVAKLPGCQGAKGQRFFENKSWLHTHERRDRCASCVAVAAKVQTVIVNHNWTDQKENLDREDYWPIANRKFPLFFMHIVTVQSSHKTEWDFSSIWALLINWQISCFPLHLG